MERWKMKDELVHEGWVERWKVDGWVDVTGGGTVGSPSLTTVLSGKPLWASPGCPIDQFALMRPLMYGTQALLCRFPNLAES